MSAKTNPVLRELWKSLREKLRESLVSVMPVSGLVFTLREYPVVNEGSLIARILGGAAR